MFLGFAGEGFGRDEQALLKPGEQVQVDRYVLRLDAIRATDDSQKQMVTAHVTVLDPAGASSARCTRPSGTTARGPTSRPPRSRSGGRWPRISTSSWPASSSASRPPASRFTSTSWSTGSGSASACWRFGTGIALLPERVFSFAGARGSASRPRRRCCCSACCSRRRACFAQTTGTLVERSQLERELANEVMCTCGCGLPAGTCGMMNCAGKAAQLAKVKQLVSRRASRATRCWRPSSQDFGGQHILARPIDEGYHRLLWILPYSAWPPWRRSASAWSLAAGRAGAPTAMRRRPWPAPAPTASSQQQLDDELRDLD